MPRVRRLAVRSSPVPHVSTGPSSLLSMAPASSPPVPPSPPLTATPPPSVSLPPVSSSLVHQPPPFLSPIPPTSSSLVPPTSSSLVPPASSSLVPPASSSLVPSASSLISPLLPQVMQISSSGGQGGGGTGKRAGRTGRQNWDANDLNTLIDVIETTKPLTVNGWQKAADYYNNTYAREKGRSFRNGRGLQEKFDALCKGPATGAGGLSDRQQKARAVQQTLHELQGARRFLDEADDMCDLEEDIDEEEIEVSTFSKY